MGVDPAGEVVFCLGLGDLPGDLDASLNGWLRAWRVRPDPEASGVVLEVVRVYLEAVQVPRTAPGPESSRNPEAS